MVSAVYSVRPVRFPFIPNSDKVWKALADPEIRVVAQIAPAVRVAVGDHYGLQKGRSVMGKIVNALHRMGFDEVYDTSFQR